MKKIGSEEMEALFQEYEYDIFMRGSRAGRGVNLLNINTRRVLQNTSPMLKVVGKILLSLFSTSVYRLSRVRDSRIIKIHDTRVNINTIRE